MKSVIHTSNAPAAIGPYSQAILAGDTLYVSGQIALDPATGDLVGDEVQAQTKQALANLCAILDEAGFTPEDVVKTTCYLQSMDDFAAMNEVYASVFVANPPARAAFQVAKLPKGALVEIEAIAVRG